MTRRQILQSEFNHFLLTVMSMLFLPLVLRNDPPRPRPKIAAYFLCNLRGCVCVSTGLHAPSFTWACLKLPRLFQFAQMNESFKMAYCYPWNSRSPLLLVLFPVRAPLLGCKLTVGARWCETGRALCTAYTDLPVHPV